MSGGAADGGRVGRRPVLTGLALGERPSAAEVGGSPCSAIALIARETAAVGVVPVLLAPAAGRLRLLLFRPGPHDGRHWAMAPVAPGRPISLLASCWLYRHRPTRRRRPSS
jgi:hypothetical protein